MLIDIDGNIIIKNNSIFPDDNYEKLRIQALNCSRCSLRAAATQVVMGKGNTNKKIMFIGEGPGANEDKLGEPFVGRAGQLLNKIFKKTGIEREQIYITNTVKCRPPGNRNPTTEEADCCSSILISEIKIINPMVIIPLGSVALKYLFDDNYSITRMRGKWLKRGNYYILPTFHPSYLLRNPAMKKQAWRDFLLLKKAIDRLTELGY